MKKLIIIISALVIGSSSMSAQTFKFGHLNVQEIAFLTSDMDSAQVVLEKYSKDLQDTFASMQNEFYTKYNSYQQNSASWTPAVLEAKQKELQEMEQRLQQFQQNASAELQQKQQQMLTPIFTKVSEAISTVGKSNGFTYIFDTSANSIPFINDAVSIDVAPMIKKNLNIPLDKKIKAQPATAPVAQPAL